MKTIKKRAKKGSIDALTTVLSFRVTDDEAFRVKTAVKLNKVNTQEFLRKVVLDHVATT